jgi:hypothetical protein
MRLLLEAADENRFALSVHVNDAGLPSCDPAMRRRAGRA